MNTHKTYSVILRFQFPAHDEREGIPFADISAQNKADACKQARRLAEHAGHLSTGKGLSWFKAIEQVNP